jgi:hypothetical protein
VQVRVKMPAVLGGVYLKVGAVGGVVTGFVVALGVGFPAVVFVAVVTLTVLAAEGAEALV